MILQWRTFALLTVLACGLIGCAPDSTWTDVERARLQSLALRSMSPLPPSPSNRVANNPEAIQLGKMLFFDKRLSGSGDQSCASCHQVERQFSDGLERGFGVTTLMRNTPSVIGGAWQNWFYWDGRRDSLWSQALIPIESVDEMGGSRLAAVHLVASDPAYKRLYSKLFGSIDDSVDVSTLPHHGGEFSDADSRSSWHALPVETRKTVNTAYANIGKSIAAFERTLVFKPSDFDRYVDALIEEGDSAASSLLSQAAINGARLFINPDKTNCLQCHNGPLLTNGDFHNIGTGGTPPAENVSQPTGRPLDFGRLMGLQAVLLDEFNCLGEFSDAHPDECAALRFMSKDPHSDLSGSFKTPSLRNVALTGPFAHDGRFSTLAEVLQHYNKPPDDSEHELQPLNLSPVELQELEAFLLTLSSENYTF